MDYADGVNKMLHPANRSNQIYAGDAMFQGRSTLSFKNLDGFMIGRSSFGNPWCFLPDGRRPVLEEILATMELHAKLLIDTK
jgi:tRNA-dihydrouridine synthase